MSRRKREIKKSLAEVGAYFGRSIRVIRDWHDEGCPCKGGPYDLYLMSEWYFREKHSGSTDKSIDAELKRRRLEQQLKSELLDYSERIGELMPVADVKLILDTAGLKYQKCGEILKRQFGDDAQFIMLEALDSVDDDLSQYFKHE